jgi:RNA polymerase sigma factor (sigma-70 family)
VHGEHVATATVATATVPRMATDTTLVAAVRAGDDAAFEELYRRYSRRISAFVYGYLRDEGRAEDVTQEAFMSALRRMRETDSSIAFRPWIYEIARNAAIDLHRRTSRTEEVSIDESSPLPPSDRRRLVGSRAPENELVAKERLEHLRGALDELSETHHRILVLRELEGLSYREIGVRMDLTAPAVESALFRARRRLEQEYSELDTGRRCVAMRSVIARLAEGMELPRERRKLERHCLRCGRCRKRARELGVEPMRKGFASRAAALLPLPALLRRRLDPTWTAAAGSAAETGGSLAGKIGALLAAAAIAGGGGATLGGIGPLVPDGDETHATPAPEAPAKAPARGALPRTRFRYSQEAPAQGKGSGGPGRTPAPARDVGPIDTEPATPPPPPPTAETGSVSEEQLPQLSPIDHPEPQGQVAAVPVVIVPVAPGVPHASSEPVSDLGASASASRLGLQPPPA